MFFSITVDATSRIPPFFLPLITISHSVFCCPFTFRHSFTASLTHSHTRTCALGAHEQTPVSLVAQWGSGSVLLSLVCKDGTWQQQYDPFSYIYTFAPLHSLYRMSPNKSVSNLQNDSPFQYEKSSVEWNTTFSRYNNWAISPLSKQAYHNNCIISSY